MNPHGFYLTPTPRRRDLPRSQRVAPMTVTAMTAEATARALAPTPGAPLVLISAHLNETHARTTGRHVAPLTIPTHARNAAALREMGEVAR